MKETNLDFGRCVRVWQVFVVGVARTVCTRSTLKCIPETSTQTHTKSAQQNGSYFILKDFGDRVCVCAPHSNDKYTHDPTTKKKREWKWKCAKCRMMKNLWLQLFETCAIQDKCEEKCYLSYVSWLVHSDTFFSVSLSSSVHFSFSTLRPFHFGHQSAGVCVDFGTFVQHFRLAALYRHVENRFKLPYPQPTQTHTHAIQQTSSQM